jgi:hypothetical protein
MLPPCQGYLDTGGVFIEIAYPNELQTQALGINNSDQIVGWFSDGNSHSYGFLEIGVLSRH